MTFRPKAFAAVAAFAGLLVAGSVSAADGDPARGEKLFFSTAQCKVCHSTKKDVKRVGPSLFGVVGRKCGTGAKQRYSGNYKTACEKTAFVWDEVKLDEYLEDPTAYISKIAGQTKRSPMSKVTKKAQDRADIIAFLKTLQ